METLSCRALRLTLSSLLILGISACASKRNPAAPEMIAELRRVNKVIIVQYDPPKFSIYRRDSEAEDAALGLPLVAIGGAISAGMKVAEAKDEGVKFIAAAQLTDPIALVESRFLPAWQRESGVHEIGAPVTTDNDSPKALATKFGSGYVLDFRTMDWEIQTMPRRAFSSDQFSYRTVYRARARLIHLDDRSIQWEGRCPYTVDPSLTPILTPVDLSGVDGGVAVKSAMKILAETCADHLWRQFFGRQSGPDFVAAK